MQVVAYALIYNAMQGEWIHIGFPLIFLGMILHQSGVGILMMLGGVILCCL